MSSPNDIRGSTTTASSGSSVNPFAPPDSADDRHATSGRPVGVTLCRRDASVCDARAGVETAARTATMTRDMAASRARDEEK